MKIAGLFVVLIFCLINWGVAQAQSGQICSKIFVPDPILKLVSPKSPALVFSELRLIEEHLRINAEVGVWYAVGWDGTTLASSPLFTSGQVSRIAGPKISAGLSALVAKIQNLEIPPRAVREVVFTHIHPKSLLASDFSDSDWALFMAYQKNMRAILPEGYAFPFRGALLHRTSGWFGKFTKQTTAKITPK